MNLKNWTKNITGEAGYLAEFQIFNNFLLVRPFLDLFFVLNSKSVVLSKKNVFWGLPFGLILVDPWFSFFDLYPDIFRIV